MVTESRKAGAAVSDSNLSFSVHSACCRVFVRRLGNTFRFFQLIFM